MSVQLYCESCEKAVWSIAFYRDLDHRCDQCGGKLVKSSDAPEVQEPRYLRAAPTKADLHRDRRRD